MEVSDANEVVVPIVSLHSSWPHFDKADNGKREHLEPRTTLFQHRHQDRNWQVSLAVVGSLHVDKRDGKSV